MTEEKPAFKKKKRVKFRSSLGWNSTYIYARIPRQKSTLKIDRNTWAHICTNGETGAGKIRKSNGRQIKKMRKTEKKWNCVSLWDEFVALRWYYIQFYRSTKNCIHSNNTHLLASAASQCEPQLPMFIQFSFLCLWITHRAYRLYTLIQCFCYCWCLLKLYFSISFIFLFLFLFLLFLFHFVRIRRARAQHMVFFLFFIFIRLCLLLLCDFKSFFFLFVRSSQCYIFSLILPTTHL